MLDRYWQFYFTYKNRRLWVHKKWRRKKELKTPLSFSKNDGVDKLIKENKKFSKENRITIMLKQRWSKMVKIKCQQQKVKKVASSSGDDKRVQNFNYIKNYASATSDGIMEEDGEKVQHEKHLKSVYLQTGLLEKHMWY